MYSELVIPDIDKYTITIINNSLILSPIIKIEEFKIEDILNKDFTKSKIQNCIINNVIIDQKKYFKILLHVYSLIDKKIIINNTKLNIKTNTIKTKGFEWYPSLGLSIQGVSSNKCITEIIHMCESQNINIKICILLENNETINISY